MTSAIDMTDSIAPKSDQLNADDLLTGPRTFTIAEAKKTSGEQPFAFVLVEFPDGRPFYPCKSMRRVMVHAWGPDAATYVGKRLTLFRDPGVKWGGQAIGGIRISAMSDLKGPLTLALTETRGQRKPYRVQPLADAAPTSPVVTTETLDELLGLFARKGIAEQSQLSGVNQVTGGSATDLECITEQEAQQVIERLKARPDAGGDQ